MNEIAELFFEAANITRNEGLKEIHANKIENDT